MAGKFFLNSGALANGSKTATQELSASSTQGTPTTTTLITLGTAGLSFNIIWSSNAAAHSSAAWPLTDSLRFSVDVSTSGANVSSVNGNSFIRNDSTLASTRVSTGSFSYNFSPTSGTGIRISTTTADANTTGNAGSSATDRLSSMMDFQTSNSMSGNTFAVNVNDPDSYTGHPLFTGGATWTGPLAAVASASLSLSATGAAAAGAAPTPARPQNIQVTNQALIHSFTW